jgi:hypothetical protein
MNVSDSVFQKAVIKLLVEIFNGPPGDEAYVLNPGDPGLLRQLESIPSGVASAIPISGKSSIAAHADHVQYGLSLLTRWVGGEENPWATADWNASWKRTTVSEGQWKTLLSNLRRDAEVWRTAVSRMSSLDDLSASGTLASVAHTAYHLGAIRQILAAVVSR